VNREFRKVFRGRAFMSACCALVDSQGNVTFSGAGHPPLLVRRADGRVEALDSHGTLLGVQDVDQIEQSHATLHTDDTAVLYSDGLLAFKKPDGERYSSANLQAAMRTITPDAEFFGRLVAALRAGSNGEPCEDDVAAIALRRS
jgi:sigma-B regulation protein RsbU (phosphoserine phosphatase)